MAGAHFMFFTVGMRDQSNGHGVGGPFIDFIVDFIIECSYGSAVADFYQTASLYTFYTLDVSI
jgi:hypothetical protein